jgi:hypothetical protein
VFRNLIDPWKYRADPRLREEGHRRIFLLYPISVSKAYAFLFFSKAVNGKNLTKEISNRVTPEAMVT